MQKGITDKNQLFVSMSVRTKIVQSGSIIKSFFKFLWKRKLYWLIPLMIILMIFAILLIFAEASGLGPLIYPFI